MNETIGAKGGANDRRRTLKITRQRKKKLEEKRKLKELENKVRKQQRYTLIKTIPIALLGGTIKTIYEIATNKKESQEVKENIKEHSKEQDITITLENGKKVIVKNSNTNEIKEQKAETISPQTSQKNKEPIIVLKDGQEISIKDLNKNPINEDTTNIKKEKEAKEVKIKIKKAGINQVTENENKKQEYNINYDYSTSVIDERSLPTKTKEKIQKLKAHKIIETYEQELKEIRYELRNLTSDYRVLAGQEEEIVYSEDAALVLDKLTEVISRIEALKRKLQIEDLDSYDDNYIYTLIEDYLVEFKRGTVISEIKDSPLYILISEKLAELDDEKDYLQERVAEKKENLQEQEIKFEDIQERFYSLEKANQDLLQFQNEQDKLLRQLEEKVKNATTVEEKVKVEVAAMNHQSKRLLNLLALQMFLPGPKGVKRVTAAAAAYLYFTSRLLKPKTTTKKYQVITVKDYSSDIKKGIETIEDAENLLSKTDYQIDKMMWEIKEMYHDYINLIPEYSELLSHLDQIKGDIKEKEYEMAKIKQQQINLLEKNNAKVLTK